MRTKLEQEGAAGTRPPRSKQSRALVVALSLVAAAGMVGVAAVALTALGSLMR